MRNLFLALVLVNLAFAAWHRWYAREPSGYSVVADRRIPTITLVSELQAPEADGVEDAAVPPEAASVQIPVSVDSTTERCISIGPFRELSQAAAAAGNLRTMGYEPNQRVAEGDIWVGYWVHLSAIPTRDRAEEILSELVTNGVSDSYIVPGNEDSQIISLGIFSETSRAGRRREDVRELGYEPAVVERSRRGTVYWVDVTMAADQTLDVEPLQAPGRISRLEQRDCPFRRN